MSSTSTANVVVLSTLASNGYPGPQDSCETSHESWDCNRLHHKDLISSDGRGRRILNTDKWPPKPTISVKCVMACLEHVREAPVRAEHALLQLLNPCQHTAEELWLLGCEVVVLCRVIENVEQASTFDVSAASLPSLRRVPIAGHIRKLRPSPSCHGQFAHQQLVSPLDNASNTGCRVDMRVGECCVTDHKLGPRGMCHPPAKEGPHVSTVHRGQAGQGCPMVCGIHPS
mmetsp:Transcript_50143/g.126391  ORF Transcript_50143/g.126391 Transcript_50143/m.126391 type:complete len:229 (-) Transcript_50143:128-814(-)